MTGLSEQMEAKLEEQLAAGFVPQPFDRERALRHFLKWLEESRMWYTGDAEYQRAQSALIATARRRLAEEVEAKKQVTEGE